MFLGSRRKRGAGVFGFLFCAFCASMADVVEQLSIPALDAISQCISHEDEGAKRASGRWLYVAGAPGSGKSAVILDTAIRAAKSGIHVFIVCPTRCIFDEGIVQ